MQKIGAVVMAMLMSFGLFGCAKSPQIWRQMELGRNHMNSAMCFSLEISTDENDTMLLIGYCTDRDGKEYSSEIGILISAESSQKLRDMEFDTLPNKRRKIFFWPPAKDETVVKMSLEYEGGKVKQKEITNDMLESVLAIAIKEFQENALNANEYTERD